MHHHFVYSGQIEAQINYIQSYPISNHSMMEALPLLTWHSFILNYPPIESSKSMGSVEARETQRWNFTCWCQCWTVSF